MSKHIKYALQVLQPLVQSSTSFAGVLKKLGRRTDGGTYASIKKQINELKLDTTHFLGHATNRHPNHRGGPEKLHWTKILVKHRRSRKEFTGKLRKAMVESGITFICATCGSEPLWNGKPLVLEISHKNGDPRDNQRHNLQFECPNCHSQTEDFAGRGCGKNKVWPVEERRELSDAASTATWEEVAKKIVVGGLIPPKKYMKAFRHQQWLAKKISEKLAKNNK